MFCLVTVIALIFITSNGNYLFTCVVMSKMRNNNCVKALLFTLSKNITIFL